MKKEIKISVISPIYKVPEDLLRNNIEHLINQTLKEIEIILVDDGSPDNCGKVCDEYAKQDNRIVVIHQSNKGLCGARNAGQKKSKGEYIIFVDGDDFLEYNALEKLYNSMNKEKYDVVIGCILKDYGNKISKFDYSIFKPNKVYRDDECKFLQKQVLNFKANISAVYAKIYRREFLLENDIYHKEFLRQGAEGLEFLIRVFEKTKTVKFIPDYIHHYMYNDSSITEKHNENNHKMVIRCFEEIMIDIKNNNKKEDLQQCIYNRMLYVIITTAISGYFSPSNPESYFIAKKKYKEYLNHNLVKDSLKKGDKTVLDKQRRIILFLISHKFLFVVNFIAKIRAKQKQIKRGKKK